MSNTLSIPAILLEYVTFNSANLFIGVIKYAIYVSKIIISPIVILFLTIKIADRHTTTEQITSEKEDVIASPSEKNLFVFLLYLYILSEYFLNLSFSNVSIPNNFTTENPDILSCI